MSETPHACYVANLVTFLALHTKIMKCHLTYSSVTRWDTPAFHVIQWMGYLEHYGTTWIVTVEVGHSCFAFLSLRFISQTSIEYCNTFILGLTPRHWVMGLRLFDFSSFAVVGNFQRHCENLKTGALLWFYPVTPCTCHDGVWSNSTLFG
jgi:hypothetical protein